MKKFFGTGILINLLLISALVQTAPVSADIAERAESAGAYNSLSNAKLFLQRWAKNPLQMGSVVPSSPALCRRIANQVRQEPGKYVVELGAGTGVVSRALLKTGLAPEQLVVVEIVPEMADRLRKALPGVQVVCGDAFKLEEELPPEVQGNISDAICGIPLVLLPRESQRAFVDSVRSVTRSPCDFLLYTYCITSPLPFQDLSLAARRLDWTPLNFPPASVWRYSEKQ
jgi:phosphatidylethanolamine/phosphatidyl-N-methylethanolamine N-methyltransferase